MNSVPATAKNVSATPPSAPRTEAARVRVVKKHPLAIRWFHWINFPVLAIMVWSGVLILWAYPAYPTANHAFKVPERISVYKWGAAAIYDDTPDPDNKPRPEGQRYDFNFGARLAEGMAWHFALAWLFTLNGIAYVLYLWLSKEWKYLLPRKESFAEAFKVVLHDLHLWKKPLPPGKFNHAQRIAYTGVIALGAGMVVTGIAIYKPAQLDWLIRLLGGYQAARTEHFLITALIVSFFFVHVAQVIRAGWNNFRAMVTGYEVERVRKGKNGGHA